MAEKWGNTPWYITGEDETNITRRKWFMRARAYYSLINQRDARLRKEIEATYAR